MTVISAKDTIDWRLSGTPFSVIKKWMNENLEGEYKIIKKLRHDRIEFEKESDAVLFSLYWR